MTDDRGYSTTMDALLFLVMVSACAVIMSPALLGHSAERASADRGMRELAASTLVSMETEKVDWFEYRILGDVADQIALLGGINATNDLLYREVSKAVLGRGSRHKTPMDLAAEDAACQFLLRRGDQAIRLNPLTGEYDRETRSLIDKAIRSRIDSRYGYEFTLRWVPFTGVPLEGNVSLGRPHPPGAMSVQTYVTMPYTTNITVEYLEKVNRGDLEAINRSIAAYQADQDRQELRAGIRQSLHRCLENTTREDVREIWGNTLGSDRASDSRADPSLALESLSTNETLNRQLSARVVCVGEDAIVRMVADQNAESLDALAESCAASSEHGGPCYSVVQARILSWLQSRYEPSRARVALFVWVGP